MSIDFADSLLPGDDTTHAWLPGRLLVNILIFISFAPIAALQTSVAFVYNGSRL